MDISKMIGPSLDIKWDQDGNKIAWSLAPFGALGPLHTRAMGPVTSGIIDLVENTNQVLWQELPASTKLASWSPDGKWLLFSDNKGLYVGSIKQRNIRRLVTEQYGTTFYGWLTIP